MVPEFAAVTRWIVDDLPMVSLSLLLSMSYGGIPCAKENKQDAMTQESKIRHDRPFQVADWHIEPSLGRISRGDQSIKVEPKVMAVLECLANEAGNVISREQLEATVWAGQIVGYDSLASTIIKLRKAFSDDSKNPSIIETVPKRGYRLIATVAQAKPSTQTSGQEAPVSTSQTVAPQSENQTVVSGSMQHDARERKKNTTGFIIMSLVLLALGLATYISVNQFGATTDKPQVFEPVAGRTSHTIENSKPSVAVLPFKNISNDPQQDYFSDGITADLITDLSKLSALSVIAHNSVFSYKNQSVDVRKVGEELGARYIIEGSVRKAGDAVRISARLIDSQNGFNLWAERFDGTLTHVFDLQDEVTARIVDSLKVKLTQSERNRLAHKYTNSIEAYDYFLQGWQYFWNMSKDANINARDYYLKAIELDKNFARAYSNLALTYSYEYVNSWSDDPKRSIELANEMVNKAVELDNSLPQVYWAKGLIQIYSREYAAALKTAEKAISLDPNFADGYALLATALHYGGKSREALEVMSEAMRLNPRYPYIYRVMRGEIYFNQHDYENAIHDFLFSLERNPEAQEPRLWLAAAYAYVGKFEDAKWEIEQLRSTDAELTVARFEQVIPLNDPVQRKHLIEGLIKAGLQ